MKNSFRCFILIGAAVGMALLTGCRKEIKYLGVDFTIQHKVLKNKLTVLVVEVPEFRFVSYQTWIRAGSIDENWDKTGISQIALNLLERNLNQADVASDKEKSWEKVFTELAEKGVQYQAQAGREATSFSYRLRPENLPDVIALDSSRFRSFSVSPIDFNGMKLLQLEDIRLRFDGNLDAKMQLALWQSAYRVHPYSRPMVGYPQDIVGLKIEDAEEFIRRAYRPDYATVIVVGPVKASSVMTQIENQYGDNWWKNLSKDQQQERKSTKDHRSQLQDEPEQTEELYLTLKEEAGLAKTGDRFAIGFRIASAKESEAFTADVLNQIVFEGEASRASKRWLSDVSSPGTQRLLALSSESLTPMYSGLITVYGVLPNGVKFSEFRPDFDLLLDEVQKKGVTENEISRAIRELTHQLLDNLRSPAQLARLLGTVFVTLGEFDSFQKDLEKYLSITPKEVQDLSQKVFNPNNRTYVVMTPKSSATTAKGSGQ